MQTNEAIAPSSDKRRIEILLLALKPLNDLRGSIPLSYALTFLAVAREEGKAIGIYASEMDLSRFMMSRYVQCLGDRGRYGTPGLGLVTVKRTRAFAPRRKCF